MYALQIQNVKRNTSKTADVSVLNKTEDVEVTKNDTTTTEINNLTNIEPNETNEDKDNFQNKII
jgi:hypothetical protein